MDVYTQPPPLLEEEVKKFLEKAKIARICTHNKDGTIHAVPVWFIYKNEKIMIGAPKKSRRVNNLKRNSNVTVLVDEEGPPTRAVIIYGEASLDDKDIDNIAHAMFERYMPQEEAKNYWKGLSELTEWLIIDIKPTRIVTFDYAKDKRYLDATKKYSS